MTTHPPTGQLVGYARVSSLEQNLNRQLDQLAKCDKIFAEKRSGGSRGDRDQLEALLSYVRAGDKVLVTSMDRLARSVSDLSTIVSDLTSKGVAIQFQKEGLTFSPDREDPYAVFQLQLIGAVAQLERSLIRERQAEGIAAAKKRGVYQGRAKSLTADEADELRKLVAMGMSKAAVGRRFGISRSTVYRYLESKQRR